MWYGYSEEVKMMAFEYFTDKGRGFRPRVSIRKQGQIGLNQGSVRRFSLDLWQYVILGYDRESKQIALRKADSSNDPGAQRVLIKQGSVTISARSFLEYFDIDYRDETRQYDVIYDEQQQLLIVTLDRENVDSGIVVEQEEDVDCE